MLEVERRPLTRAPDAEAGLADHRGVLPADAEIEFGVDAILAVEQGPRAAATEAGLLFVGPVAERDER